LIEHAYRCGSRRIVLTVRRTSPGSFAVVVDGQARTVEATPLDATTLQLRLDGTTYALPIARVGDAYHVAIDGQVYVLVPDAAATASGDRAAVLAPPQIVAPMPGKVLQVLVQAGQRVAAGDGLLILEAMKMEHRMVAELPATVRAVHVTDGQMVDAGVVLVDLEYDEAD
jgi:3-methylcrotonyl-CoA carboxylase alpha subunit